MEITINITQKDIKDGGLSCRDCPAALAIKRRLKKDAFVSVDNFVIIIGRLKGQGKGQPPLMVVGARLNTPNKAAQFVQRYDNNHFVYPVQFQLSIPKRFLK